MVEERQVELSEQSGCSRGFFSHPAVQQLVAHLLLTLSKSAGLLIATVWVMTDLLILLPSSPCPGAVVLGSVAFIASLLALLTELGSWLLWLPRSMERFRHVAATTSTGALEEARL